MYIRLKGIDQEVIGDAPFVGLRLNSIACDLNCYECHNEHLKQSTVELFDLSYIKALYKSNPLHKGIIFGGLEWSNQEEELRHIMSYFLNDNIPFIIYTGLTESNFKSILNKLPYTKLYVKYGSYNVNLSTHNNNHFGVQLASANQYIKLYQRGK